MKKTQQLGEHHSTAQAKLKKLIMFNFLEKLGKDKCYRCDKLMTVENYSIDHKIPWLDSENPVQLFFDIKNIEFSHFICNIKEARHENNFDIGKWRHENSPGRKHGTYSCWHGGCRCEPCIKAQREYKNQYYKNKCRG